MYCVHMCAHMYTIHTHLHTTRTCMYTHAHTHMHTHTSTHTCARMLSAYTKLGAWSTQESFSVGMDTEGLYGDQGMGAQTTPPPILPGDANSSLGDQVSSADMTPGAGVTPGAGSPNEGLSSPSEERAPPIGERAPPPDDCVILREHEDALRKLEALQKEMIGGEKAGMWFVEWEYGV